MAVLTIIDESTRGKEQSWSLEVLEETISLRELIRRRIYQEVTEYNARAAGAFRGLVQPTEAERVLNGCRLRPGRRIDWEAQYHKAIEAFRHTGFLLLVDDRHLVDLDDEVDLRPGSNVTFLRLLPLVGG